MTELVGFVVQGRRFIERLQINDMDSLVLPDGKRLLPLLRTLRAFQFPIQQEEAGIIRFTPEGVGEVELNLRDGQIRIKDQTRPIEIRQAVSEITLKPDIYLLPEDLSEILDMELVWNDDLYEYRIQLDRKLSIWQTRAGKSLLSIETQYLQMDLPEILSEADRSRELLQFAQFDWNPSYNWQRSQSETSHIVDIAGPRETLWGNVADGQYKIQISHPDRVWSNTDGWQWPNDDPYIAKADWFEWVHRMSGAEIAVGDSSFGLSNLIYPTFNATGIRINGLTGWDPEELKADQSGLGLRQYFGQAHVFEGPAPIDATVELLINGRSVDTQNVRPEADSPPGMGIYRFEDIELPSGILNEVTIVIREANGNEVRVEKSIVGIPQLMPKGHTAYLGILGTKRETASENRESFDAGDFYGYITGARFLRGLTDRLTVGTTLACEEGHNHRYLADIASDSRPYPESSSQVGVMFSCLPFDNLIVSGDAAGSQGSGQDEYDDLALRMQTEYLPTRNLSLDLDLLSLGSDYFDGTDPEVSDRQGGEIGMSWKWNRKWSLETGIGQIRNNLDGDLDDTTVVDYQNLGLSTSVFPRSSLRARLHHLAVNTEDDPRILTELAMRTALSRSLSLYGQAFLGEELSVEDSGRFLSLLRLRHAPRLLRPSQYWTLRKSLNPANTLSLIYNDSGSEETLSLIHDLKVDVRDHSLRFRTELIKELMDDPDGEGYGFRGRGEYLFDRAGYNYVGMTGEYRHGNYGVLLYLNIQQLYSQHEGRLIRINESRIRTAYGTVHGKVFIDYNGNHVPDADEPGVPKIKVSLGGNISVLTDKQGYYILSAPFNTSEVRVYLDPSTVPAIYTVTHGTQLARVYRDSVTEVNLSVSPLISIVGRVAASRPHVPKPNASEVSLTVLDTEDANDVVLETKPLPRVRVYIIDAKSELLVADSVTASDGSYYLGDVKPGQYKLGVDLKTLPATYAVKEPERVIVIQPTREEFLEIEQPDFIATVSSEPAATESP